MQMSGYFVFKRTARSCVTKSWIIILISQTLDGERILSTSPIISDTSPFCITNSIKVSHSFEQLSSSSRCFFLELVLKKQKKWVDRFSICIKKHKQKSWKIHTFDYFFSCLISEPLRTKNSKISLGSIMHV